MSDGMAAARDLIPARPRKILYVGLSLASYTLGAVAVGLAAAGGDVPSWVTTSLAVLGALGGPYGQLAATNVPPAGATSSALVPDDDGEDSAVDLPPAGFDITDDDTLDDVPEQMELGQAEDTTP